MPKIFISYRRDDTAPISARIGDDLKRRFGEDAVFFDVEDIPLGVDFREYLSSAVSGCELLLAVISRNWIGSFRDSAGTWKRRIDEPADYVRIEVESALELGVTVVPLQIDDASMPTENELPSSLRRLPYLNAAKVRRGDGFPEDMERLAGQLEARSAPDARERHAPAPATPEQADARHRIKHGGETERVLRAGTVLLAEIAIAWDHDASSDSERVVAAVSSCLTALEAIAQKHGGTCERMDVDHRVRAIFAMEASAHAAVNAAIEMRAEVERYAQQRRLTGVIELRAGANSGSMITQGQLPGAAGRLNVGGASVELAKRLEATAPPGCIYVGEDTWRATQQLFEWSEPKHVLPGKGQGALTAYAVTSRTTSHDRPRPSGLGELDGPLVGRDAELTSLRGRLSRLGSGEGGVATITGEAGLGKSRLLNELAADDEAVGLGWLEGRCLSIGGRLSFHPFSDLLRGWAGVSGDADAGSTQQRAESAIQELFGDESDDLLPYMLTLMGLTANDRIRSRLEGIGSEAMQNLVIRTMTRFVTRLAERQPLVLVFDDMHWADASSVELLASLLRLSVDHPVLFLLAQRDVGGVPEPILEAIRKIDPSRLLEVRVEPLDQSACDALVESKVGKGYLSHSIRRRIEERTEGNPYYIGEVLRLLREKGDLVYRDGGLHAEESIETAVLPDSIKEGILSRMDGLTVSAQRVLRIAAVVGRSSYLSVLSRVAEGVDVEEALAELVDSNFLARHESSGDTYFGFTHPMVQEATYEAITQENLREHHRRIAEAIEAAFTEREPGYFGMLAYHFGQARDPVRAEKYLMLAGDEASRLAAPGEALHFFEEASRLILAMRDENAGPEEDQEQRYDRAQLEKRLALAFFNRGKMDEGREHFNNALVLLGQRVPRTPTSQVLHAAESGLSVLKELYLSGDPSHRPAPTSLDLEVIEMMYRGAFAQVTTATTAFVIDCMEGLKRLNQVDPTKVPNAGGIYAASMVFFAYSGLSIGVGNRLLKLASSLVDEADTRESFLYKTMNFIHQFLSGDWDERHVIDEELIQENLQIGELWNVTNYLPLEALRRLYCGRFPAAREYLERIAKIGELYDYDLARSNELAVKMFIALERRELAEALEVSKAYYEAFDEPLLNLLALSTRVKIELLLGEEDAAASALEKAAHIVDEGGLIPPFQLGAFSLARFALALHRYEAALSAPDKSGLRGLRRETRSAGRKAWRHAKKVSWRRPETLRLLGRTAWLSGHRRKAAQWWTEGVREARRLGMRPELGRIYAEAGSRLEEHGSALTIAGEDAATCVEQAQKLFEELDLQWDLERLTPAGKATGPVSSS